MRRDGAIIFVDLIGKLDVLRATCAKCERAGRYRLHGLIEERGRNAKIVDWLGEITAVCPKKVAPQLEHCAVPRFSGGVVAYWRPTTVVR